MNANKLANDKIDFVLTWVDNNDPAWQSEFAQYSGSFDGDFRLRRYRDWGNLKYIFRGFEKFAPWVNKIHFVTWGHVPSWLDCSHNRLSIVKHSDYIPIEFLPVFNSHPIELNFHRIKGLASKFVYFNDDTFLLRPMSKGAFFKGDKPRDVLCFNLISDSTIANNKINNLQIIQKYFRKKDVLRNNFLKIFNFRYSPIEVLKTIFLLPWPSLTGFYDPHMPLSYRKETFEELWRLEEEEFIKTLKSKFRSKSDVSHFVFRYYHLCKGDFYPANRKKFTVSGSEGARTPKK